MDPMLGTIFLWPIPFVPVGYAICNGGTLPVLQNTALFSLIGTRYGGDGVNTFGLPDFRNRVPRGLTNVFDPVASAGADTYLGNAVGTASITLSAANLPAHNHSVSLGNLSISIPVSNDVTTNTDTPGPTTVLTKGFITTGINTNPTKQYTTVAATTHLLPFNVPIPAVNTGSTGSGATLNTPVTIPLNIPTIPSYCPVNFIIATVGVYPQRS